MKWKKTDEYKSLTRTNKMVFKQFVKKANNSQQNKMIDTLDTQISNLLLLKDMMVAYRDTGDCRVIKYEGTEL